MRGSTNFVKGCQRGAVSAVTRGLHTWVGIKTHWLCSGLAGLGFGWFVERVQKVSRLGRRRAWRETNEGGKKANHLPPTTAQIYANMNISSRSHFCRGCQCWRVEQLIGLAWCWLDSKHMYVFIVI